MNRRFLVSSVLLICVFSLFGCGTTNKGEEKVSGETKVTHEFQQVDDFQVVITVENEENDLQVYATITYTGEEAEKDIYHGGSIFFFNVYQQDGDFEYLGGMDQPLLTTTLIRNEPYREDFNWVKSLNLKPGTYEFEAIASISLDSDNVVGTGMEIPVSKIEEIK